MPLSPTDQVIDASESVATWRTTRSLIASAAAARALPLALDGLVLELCGAPAHQIVALGNVSRVGGRLGRHRV